MENNQQTKLQSDEINVSKLETYDPPRVDRAPLEATRSMNTTSNIETTHGDPAAPAAS